MAQTTRLFFERLTWDEGAATASPECGFGDAEAEAATVLMALGGWSCSKCDTPLSPAKGYACCFRAHCPYCGQELDGYQGTCAHYVYTFDRNRYVPRLYLLFDRAGAVAGLEEEEIHEAWSELFQPTPPARRLPGQKGRGYPRWSREQIEQAYLADVLPHIETIWGADLRQWNRDGFGKLLLGVLRPDVKTTVSDRHGHWRNCYFHADPQAAADRVFHFTRRLRQGTELLRTLPPVEIVRLAAKPKEPTA